MTGTVALPAAETAGRSRRRRILRRAGMAALGVAAALLVGGIVVYSSLPSVADAPARMRAIIHAHGGLAATVPANSRIARATVAIEDHRFFEHGAIDPIAIARVAADSVLHPGVDPGGSTIAQQLAKVLYHEPSSILGQLKAVGLAFKLEQRYSKAHILSMYMNAIYYGHGYWGVGRASRGFFGRPADQLSWSQAALLAGLPQAPSLLDPVRHPAAARARRRAVVHELVSTGALSRATARAVAISPLSATPVARGAR